MSFQSETTGLRKHEKMVSLHHGISVEFTNFMTRNAKIVEARNIITRRGALVMLIFLTKKV